MVRINNMEDDQFNCLIEMLNCSNFMEIGIVKEKDYLTYRLDNRIQQLIRKE